MNVTRYKCSVLAVDDDPNILALLTNQLSPQFEVLTVCSSEQARSVMARTSIDILLADLQLPDESGLRLLDWTRRTSPRTSRVLLTGTARIQDAVDAINHIQIHRLVLKPWRAEDLLQTLRAAARGLMLERSHEELLDELRRLNQELERRVADRTQELELAITQIQQKNRILEQMALTDPLTQVPNRRAIDILSRKELQRRNRNPSPIALGLIDADHFKQINTEHLQTGGDHVLVWLAKVLNDAIRASDSLGRVGGEEFMVLAPDTDTIGAEALAERLRSRVESSITEYHNKSIRITVSIGFAIAESGTPVGYDQLRETAAAALKEAKEQGRNRCRVRTISQPAMR